jgi:hypothetical protein
MPLTKATQNVIEGIVSTGSTGISDGSFTVGQQYKITSLGTTTHSQWNTIAGTTGQTYVVGSLFVAATTGAGSGNGAAAVARTLANRFADVVNVLDFGAVGDGSNETTKIQDALNASQGKTLLFEAGKTYGYTQLTIKQNTQIVSYNSTFNRLAASTSQGFIIESGVAIDSLIITTPGGGTGVGTGDKGVLIKGSNVLIDKLSITATAEGVYNSTNYALEIESIPSGTKLSNITINNFYCKYFSAGMFIKNVELMTVNSALIEYFRNGIYLRDTSRSVFNNVTCAFTSSTCYGAPGENGLLIESILASNSCFDLRFNGWSVIGAGEHSYRLGGQLAIRDVWFENCRSVNSGSAIVVNNPAATEWHGGCGFKVLGATTVVGQKHKNIYFNNCTVEDINETFGSFPVGHGAGNFAGFQVAVATNVHISNCSVKTRNNTYSCGNGAEIYASDHVYFTDVSFEEMYRHVRIYEAGSPGTYPGWDLPCENIYFNNCLIQSSNNIDYLISISDVAQNYDHKEIHLNKCHLSGAKRAVRIQPITGTGSYENIYLDFTYTDCLENPATSILPIIYGDPSVAMLNVRAPWRSLVSGPNIKDGSIWQDTYLGQVREKSNNIWGVINNRYKVTIANDSFTTIIPPTLPDPGFLLIAGEGSQQNMMAWYRASATPSSIKYAGATQTVIVNTPLNGTTGSVGNVTVGVQEDLIYIENRNGLTNDFIITFL